MKIYEELSNTDLLMYYHRLYDQIELVLSKYINKKLKLGITRIYSITRVFNNTISVSVICGDGNLYTFTLREDLSVIETK